MTDVTITRPEFPTFFGGFGFHNSEALFYRLCEKEQFDQKICKCYREISPGFCRTFAGYPNWSKESMDTFADYYERMQKWTDTPIYFAAAKGQLHFNDQEREEYAENVAQKLDYLINVRGVKQLRYYCYSNEMSMNDWGGLLKDLPLFHKYHELLFQAFQRHNLNIGLLATDASPMSNWDSLNYVIDNMRRITEDLCAHHYINGTMEQMRDPGLYQWFFDACREWVLKAAKCDGKRLILGELGVNVQTAAPWHLAGVLRDVNNWNYNGQGGFGGLLMAEMALAAINAGVFAIALWTFCDYPDPYVCHYSERDSYGKAWGECERFISQTQDVKYNKWGMIKWEDDGDYSVREQYYALGLVSRYCRRNAKVMDIASDDPLLRICGLLNRDGSVSVLVINRHTEMTPIKLRLSLKHIEKQPPFRVYEYDSHNVPMNEFGDLQDFSDVISAPDGKIEYELKPESLTVFTTDYAERPDVWAKKVVRDGEMLHWDAVKDDLHCYYRVYRGETPDFVPSRANQIASTVAETLDFGARYLDDAAILNVKGDYYKVLSINRKR
ncbi:MAG: hypothetical protein IJ493_10590 [Clostridia bacterium]|nr:hypothetical protein [Clostridia bacterium]